MTSDDSTSLSKMKTLQFNDKMATLNRDFLKSLRVWYEQCPHYDFVNSICSFYFSSVAVGYRQVLRKTCKKSRRNLWTSCCE